MSRIYKDHGGHIDYQEIYKNFKKDIEDFAYTSDSEMNSINDMKRVYVECYDNITKIPNGVVAKEQDTEMMNSILEKLGY